MNLTIIFTYEIIEEKMTQKNKGNFIVGEILKFIQKSQNSSPEDDPESRQLPPSTHSIPSEDSPQERNIVMVKKQRNLARRIFRIRPALNTNHIFRLYGFFNINEQAIQSPGHQESYLFSHFQNRIVQRVQSYQHVLLLELTEPALSPDQPSIQYIIEKFKSKGDVKFYQIATLIEQTTQLFAQLQNLKPPQEKPESVKKWLDILGEGHYVCFLGPRKFAISKQLLTYLNYDIQQFGVQVIKYRAVLLELFSSMSYPVGSKHLLNCIKHMAELNMGKITQKQFMELTTFRFSDFIISKNHQRSFCDMTISFLNPAYLVHRVQYIYYKCDELGQPKGNNMTMAIQDQKQRIKQGEYPLLKKLKNIPNSLLKQNHKKIAGYMQLQKQQNRESSPHSSMEVQYK